MLVFLGDRVYKARKPITTPFLDFSTHQLRRADCRREIDLNRRLAPDVYLGVLEVRDEDGQTVDHVVVMRRLPEHLRLASLATSGTVTDEQLTAVARRVAQFHEATGRSPQIDQAGSPEHLTMLWTTNLDETEPFCGRFLDSERHTEIRRIALSYLAGRHPLLAERVARGRIVDGHGDLLAEDIFCLPDGPRILDCIEFADRFRWGDVLYDTSFLAMDLERLGRPDLAARFLAAYSEFSGETHPSSLEHWYIAYRALVRAKIAGMRAESGDPEAPAESAALLELCASHLARAEVRLVLVGGLPGSGKSTLARALAEQIDADLISTDVVRREVAAAAGGTVLAERRPLAEGPTVGSEPNPLFSGRYSPDRVAANYRELLRRARVALEHGDSVILDATWSDPAHRAAARELARTTCSTLTELCCTVDLAVAAERLRARAQRGDDPSEATVEVLTALARDAQPWPEATLVDTSVAPSAVLERALAAIDGGHSGPE